MDFLDISLDSRYFVFHIDSSRVVGAVLSFDKSLQKTKIEFKTYKKFTSENNSQNIDGLKKAIEQVSDSLFEYIKILGVYDVDYSFVFITSP